MSKTLSITIPAWTANLLSNLLGLAGLAAICTAIGFLTDWRWSVLAGGAVGVGLAVWVQLTSPVAVPAATVTSLKKAA